MDFHLGLVCACLLTLANGHNAPPSPGFLNCGFNLTATCDDHMELFVDGNLLATSDSWKITSDVHVPANSREIEIRCVDSWIHGGILASSENGLITDGEWICSSDDGNSWTPAYEIGENGVTSKGISPEAKWIWTDRHTWKHTVQQRHTNAVCKIQLVTSKCPEPTTPTPTTPTPTTTIPPETTPGLYTLTATCDDKMKLFVDGNLLATSGNWRDTSQIAISENVQVIEIHCMDTGTVGGILASSDNGLLTNGAWNCSSDNGKTWNPAYEVGPNGRSVPDISPEAKWIWDGGCIGDWIWKYTGRIHRNSIICKIDLETVMEQAFSDSGRTVHMPNIGRLFRGYDIMKANPLPVSGLPVDPGFRRSIFKPSFEKGRKTADQRYFQPDGTSIQDCSGTCFLKFESTEIAGAKRYQDNLHRRAEVGGKGSYGVWEAKFSASVDYKKVEKSTSSQYRLFTQSSASCCKYTAQMLTNSPPPLSEDFLKGLEKLPEKYDESVYLEHITNFGTHFITEARMGSLYGQQSEITKEGWTKMLEENIDIQASASLAAYGSSLSGRYMTGDRKKEAEEFSKKTIDQKIFTIGKKPPADNKAGTWLQSTTSHPAPIKLKLHSVLELLDGNYGIKVTGAVKANMKKILDDYCAILALRGEVSSCLSPGADPSFPVPVRRVYKETGTIHLDGGFWGTWGNVDKCDFPAFVTGIQLKLERKQGGGDDTALNGIRLICSDGRRKSSRVGKWGDWSAISRCSGGYISSARIRKEKYQGSGDDTAANGMRFWCTIGEQLYPSDGYWGDYSSWGNCPSGSAIMGIQTQVEGDHGGDETALNDVRLYCAQIKSAVNGGWSSWTASGGCSATCGVSTRRLKRTCTNPSPAHGGRTCSGSNKRTTDCFRPACAVNGGWSSWSDYGECSATCGLSTKSSRRTCTKPVPANGGRDCSGANKRKTACNLAACGIDGGWSNWSNYGACSASCGVSTKKRTRTCTNPAPSHGARDCSGSNEETTNCNLAACGTYSALISGKDCFETMVKKSAIWGADTRTMQATLKIPLRDNLNSGKNGFKIKLQTDIKLTEFVFWWGVEVTPSSGNSFTISPSSWFLGKASGDVLEYSFQISWLSSDSRDSPEFTSVTINGRDVCSSGPVNGGWTVFGACSVSCGGGTEIRTCTNPPPSNNGDDCTGRKVQACNSAQCPGTNPLTDSPILMTAAPNIPQGDCTESMVMKSAIWGSDTKTMQATLKIKLSDDLKSGEDGFKINLQTDINLTNFVFWWGVKLTPSSGNSFTITPTSSFQGKKLGDILEYSFQISWRSSDSSDSPKFTSLAINGHNVCGSA